MALRRNALVVIADFGPRERYTAYAVLPDGRSACRLGEVAWRPPVPAPGAKKAPG